MSEPMFPFSGGSTAVADAPVEQTPVNVPADNANRGKLLALAGGAVVLVLGAAGYFLFFAGGSDPAPAPAPKPVTSIAPAAPAPDNGSPAAGPAKGRKITQRNFGHDPFKALIVEGPAAPAAGTTTTTGTTTTGTTTDSTARPTDPFTGQPVTDPTTTGGVSTPTQSQAHTFKVVGVSSDNTSISVKVDGKVYSHLKAGEVFATYFKVVLISGTTNAFQYGEEKFNVLGTKRLTIA